MLFLILVSNLNSIYWTITITILIMLEMDDIFFLEFSQNFAIFCKLQDGYIIK
jgi:hypothetical protein